MAELPVDTRTASSGDEPADDPRRGLAKQVLSDPGILLATSHVSGAHDQATARQNIEDTAAGHPAARSRYGSAPGGVIALNVQMLRAVVALGKLYRFRVSEFAGGEHTPGSLYYQGCAVDVDRINDQPVNAAHPIFRAFLVHAKKFGADECLGPGDQGHETHAHAGWR